MEDKVRSLICGICKGPPFSKRSSLKAHVKKFHQDKLEDLVPKKAYNIAAICKKCNKTFSKYSNLKQHVKTFHPDEVKVLVEDKWYPYKCPECSKQFSGLKNFKSHKRVHQIEMVSPCRSNQLKCALCKYEDNLKTKLIHHFVEKHEIVVEYENIQFDTLQQFDLWKLEEERETKSFFVKERSSKNTLNGTKTTYVCHRSGKYIPKGKDKRHSNKINAFCPASISITQEANICRVHYIRTHVGHQNDLGHLFLSYEEKHKIAGKISAKIPLPVILGTEENLKDNTKLDEEKLHLKKWVCAQIDKVSAVSELREVKRIIAPIEATLNTIQMKESRSLNILEKNRCTYLTMYNVLQ